MNNVDFAKRLQKVIDFYGESASSFAEKIGVQRSSISHILSGRNKPSLDFVLKVTSIFSEVDLYWLLNGVGVFPKTSTSTPPHASLQKNPGLFPTIDEDAAKKIKRIVVFYEDGTFEEYQK